MPFVEFLGPQHQRQAFDCGQKSLNRFLRQQARQNADRYLGATHVVVPELGSGEIQGYFTLVTRTIEGPSFLESKKLPPGPIGVVLLGQLAVDLRWQGKGLGAQMLLRAMAESEQAAGRVGIYAMVLDTIDDRAKQWYLGLDFGFRPLPSQPNRLYVPIAFIRNLELGPLSSRL